MTPVEPYPLPPQSRLVIYAKDQSEYIPLPAAVAPDGCILTEWELTAEELDLLFQGGRIQLWVWTFNRPLQPVMLKVAPPECGFRGGE